MANPICLRLREKLKANSSDIKTTVHSGGSYLCMEGPAFSTKAESILNHQAGISVIGMTNIPEAYLAREAGICYASIAMVTDYDAWNDHEEPVTVDAVVKLMKDNVTLAQTLLIKTLSRFHDDEPCSCRTAPKNAVMTDPKKIPAKTKQILKLIL